MSNVLGDTPLSDLSLDTAHALVVDTLSELIKREMRALAREQSHPHADSDGSDDFIKTTRERVSTLRQIRQQFEVAMTEAIV